MCKPINIDETEYTATVLGILCDLVKMHCALYTTLYNNM